MKLRRTMLMALVGVLAAGCGSSSSSPHAAPADDTTFQYALHSTLAAASLRFSVVTRQRGKTPAKATGVWAAPDRSTTTVGDVERVGIGDTAYFRGGGFGTSGWAKFDKGASGDPDFFAVLVAAQNGQSIGRSGGAYTLDTPRTGAVPAKHWKVWIDAGHVVRVRYTSGSGLVWDESFSDYGAPQTIAEPAAADVHASTTAPACAAGARSDFAGFCTPR